MNSFVFASSHLSSSDIFCFFIIFVARVCVFAFRLLAVAVVFILPFADFCCNLIFKSRLTGVTSINWFVSIYGNVDDYLMCSHVPFRILISSMLCVCCVHTLRTCCSCSACALFHRLFSAVSVVFTIWNARASCHCHCDERNGECMYHI